MDVGLCLSCGGPLPPRARSGPPRSYCSGACRSAASRARRSPQDWRPASFEPYTRTAGEPVPAVSADDLAVALAAPPVVVPLADPLARLSALVLGLGDLRREADELVGLVPPNLSWRVETVAGALHAAERPFSGLAP